jgi:hypothetical protein
MATLALSDLYAMRIFGRKAAGNGDGDALKQAAIFLASCAESETEFLLMEFHEGVRNIADDQYHTDMVMNAVQSKTLELLKES